MWVPLVSSICYGWLVFGFVPTKRDFVCGELERSNVFGPRGSAEFRIAGSGSHAHSSMLQALKLEVGFPWLIDPAFPVGARDQEAALRSH